MPRNIEMNVLNNGEYEILYPQTLSECVIGLLSDETKVLMGLTSENTPDDAFRELYLSIVLDGRALINFTVVGNDGTPCKGVQLASSNFCDGNGNKLPTVTTDDNGKISVFVDAVSVNVSVSQYANFENWSHTYSVTFGEQYDESVTLNRYDFRLFETSGNYMFSRDIVRVDVSCCGGGGGGGSTSQGRYGSESYVYTGGGGGGGYSTVQENVSFNLDELYQLVVGAGGNSIFSWDGGTSQNGGQSSFLGVIANGGGGGGNNSAAVPGSGAGGIGNGNGGDGVFANRYTNNYYVNGNNGGQGEGFIYNSLTTVINVGGGGGSGSANDMAGSGPVTVNGGIGGSPNGGNGGTLITTSPFQVDATNGIKYGGGGGSGAGRWTGRNSEDFVKSASSAGAQGCVAIRMYTAETLPA